MLHRRSRELEADVEGRGDGHVAATSRFERQLILERTDGRPGRYTVAVDEAWNCPLVPHGGLVTAVAARAMEAELDEPAQSLRSISPVFAGPVHPTPLDTAVFSLPRA